MSISRSAFCFIVSGGLKTRRVLIINAPAGEGRIGWNGMEWDGMRHDSLDSAVNLNRPLADLLCHNLRVR